MVSKRHSTIRNCMYIYSKIWKISKVRLFLPVILSLVGGLCTACIILFPKLIIDSISRDESFLFVVSIIGIRVGVTLFYNILFRIFSEKFYPLKDADINEYFVSELYKRASLIELKFLDTPEFYDKYSRSIDKAQELPGMLLGLYDQFLTFVFDTIVLVVTLTYIGPWSIIIVVLSFLFNTGVNSWISKKDYEFEVNITGEKRIFEYIKRIFYIPQYKNDLLFFNLYETAIKKYNETNLHLVKKILGYKPLRAVVSSFSNLFFNMLNLGVGGVYLGLCIVNGQATVGALVSGLYGMEELGTVFSRAGSIIPQLNQASFFITDYRDVMNAYSTLYNEGKINVSNEIIHTISFKNVSFGYHPGTDIIKNLSVTIEGGSKIALVGENGAGKSTFLKLLLKLYEPTSGNIYLNDVDYSDINTTSFYELCSPMFQETNCYAVSVNENIKIAGVHSENDDIEYALRQSGIEEKISLLPKKSDTLLLSEINTEGIDLSGGEIQKIGIARIMYRNTNLIVMDEPSAALDPFSEQKLYDTIDALSRDKTVIIVSHRLSSVKNMDRILFFENGRIVEDGSHVELMKRNGKYAQMFKIQAKRYGDNNEND